MRILRVVGSESLPCGCFVGYYETYAGKTVQVIEEQGTYCRESTHRPGSRLTGIAPDLLLAALSGDADRHGPARSH